MKIAHYLTAAAIALSASYSQAAEIDFWSTDGWNMIASEDKEGNFNRVNPGFGGQDFDAEYLFYQFDQNTNILSLGLQTGFDLIDGKVRSGNRDYFSGDLAVSFNGGGFDYAVDFGLETRGYSSNAGINATAGNNGVDDAGFYSVSDWNNDIYYSASSPYAMDEGSLFSNLISNQAGQVGDSYFRTVSFDVSGLNLGSTFDLALHWTMSCGNDAIDGSASVVPEPSSILLLGLGLLALAGARRSQNS